MESAKDSFAKKILSRRKTINKYQFLILIFKLIYVSYYVIDFISFYNRYSCDGRPQYSFYK